MSHQHPETPAGIQWSAAYWDEKYAATERLWSGNPNPRLVEQVSMLTPGRALDVGCGEGADAIWLAGRGWQVVGLDVSQVALDRAAAHAAETGVGAGAGGGSVEWVAVDLLADPPVGLEERAFDLVSAQFMHVLPVHFDRLYGRLAGAVAPGGSLLVVGHHPDDMDTGLRHADHADLMITPERVAATLPESDWDVQVVDSPTREAVIDGTTHVVTDAVVRAVRRG